jgi:hypothetical protein
LQRRVVPALPDGDQVEREEEGGAWHRFVKQCP